MAEILGVIASVIALCETAHKGTQLIAKARGAPDAYIQLQDELNAVSNYLHQVHDILQTISSELSGPSAPFTATLDHVRRVAAGLPEDIKELKSLTLDIQASAKGRTDEHGRLNISRFKWIRHHARGEELCKRILRKKVDLANAISLLHTQQSMRTTSLTTDVLKVVRDDKALTEQVITIIDSLKPEVVRVGGSVQSLPQELTEQLPNNISPVGDQESTLTSLVLGTENTSSMVSPQKDHRGHEIQGAGGTMTSVRSTLISGGRCPPSCMCQCHRGSQTGTPDLLAGILGNLLLSYHGIPYWRPRTCNHPKCRRKSPSQLRLTYLFPRWMLRRGIHVSLSCSSVTGFGASLHLAVPRIISEPRGVWAAIQSGNLSWLQDNIRAKQIFLTDVAPDGESLLMFALKFHAWNVMSYLLTEYPASALSWQAESGRSYTSMLVEYDISEAKVKEFPLVCKALEATADDRFSTPLIDAVKGLAGISVAQALGLYPGSVNDRDVGGQTALHWAVIQEDIDAVHLLLSFHANPSVGDYDKWRPLHLAADCPNLPILQALLEAGSNPHAEDVCGRQPLHYAVRRMIRDNALALLQAGAKANALDYHGWSVFMYAAYGRTTCAAEEVFSIFQLLVANGADATEANSNGGRPLDQAIFHNNAPVFRALCRLGVELHHLYGDGRTILHGVASYGRKELLLTMLEMEMSTVDPDHVDCFGYTALDSFKKRQQLTPASLFPTQTIPTAEEEELFHQLLKQMRDSYIALAGVDSEDEGEEGCDSDLQFEGQRHEDGEEAAAEYGDGGSESEEEWLDAE